MEDGRDRERTRRAEDRYRDVPRDPGGVAAARTTNGPNREAKGAPGTGVAGYSRELLRGALTYAGRGVPVFPCEPGGKSPLTADGFLEATTDEALIRGWWGRWPNANVAIPTGVRSGLLVLDVDAGEGTDSVALLELSCGQSPKTARAATGGYSTGRLSTRLLSKGYRTALSL
jgi:hypothetical protein